MSQVKDFHSSIVKVRAMDPGAAHSRVHSDDTGLPLQQKGIKKTGPIYKYQCVGRQPGEEKTKRNSFLFSFKSFFIWFF